jgi:hypothetical protein
MQTPWTQSQHLVWQRPWPSLLIFSSKAFSAIIRICRSLDSEGTLRDVDELQKTAQRLNFANVQLETSLEPAQLKRPRTDTETELDAVATECMEVTTPLLDTLRDINQDRDLRDLRSLGGDHRSRGSSSGFARLRAFRARTKAIWNQEKMDALEHRLKDSREQLMLVILLNLR